MYFVYILQCNDKTLYTGITSDLERRIREHNLSKLGAKYTRVRRPVKLVYKNSFKSKSEALIEEARIKKLKRKEKIDLINRS
jgi:putative endonuclease